jgi:DNA-directed RNA polymerase subunit RPC12/RpoP
MELYICQNCGSQFESFIDLVFDPLKQEYLCPNCKSYDVIEVDEDMIAQVTNNSGGTNGL